MNYSNKPRVLIIPAAGAGVRFQELGKNYPKCILPVQGTPIIVSAVQMLAEKTGVFDLIVIPCSNQEHRKAIADAIIPHAFKTRIVTTIVTIPNKIIPSPAVSLANAIAFAKTILNCYDVDVTVFLSDMLPYNQNFAEEVVNISPDSWGVVEKSEGDFSRWCMVDGGKDNSMVTFYDKPKKQPPTKLAACGVYRYSSGLAFLTEYSKIVEAISLDVSGRTTEIQFSEIAYAYQWNYLKAPLSISMFNSWGLKDFGTLEEYLENKGINKTRSFNKLIETQNTVIKSSSVYDKIRDEAVWLQNIPKYMRKFVPRVENVDLMRGVIEMEKIRSTNLRDVALYLDKSYDTWVEIFNSISKFQKAVESSGLETECHSNEDFWIKIRDKTIQRLNDIECIEDLDFAGDWVADDFWRCINEIISLDREDDRVCYYHGDLHFANMFYCFHYKDLKVIDPRGEVRGSCLYDIAKLCHSVFGRYDYIDSELYRIEGNNVVYYDKGHDAIEKAFCDVIFNKLSSQMKWMVLILTASLFISMIPLHEDKPEHCKLFYKEFARMVKMAKEFDLIENEEIDG